MYSHWAAPHVPCPDFSSSPEALTWPCALGLVQLIEGTTALSPMCAASEAPPRVLLTLLAPIRQEFDDNQRPEDAHQGGKPHDRDEEKQEQLRERRDAQGRYP